MASDQNLLLEIDEALKRERTEKIFKEYGPYILAGALLAILFTGLISFYRSWDNDVNAQQTEMLMEAMIAPEPAQALEKIAPELRPGQRAVALMTAAAALIAKDKTAEAQTLYTKAADDKELPATYRDLAALMSVRLAMSGDLKSLNAADLMTKLQPLMKKDNPWRWHAHIEAALISAHLQNDYQAAKGHLKSVLSTDESIQPSLQDRARALDQVFSQKIGAVKKTGSTSPDAEG